MNIEAKKLYGFEGDSGVFQAPEGIDTETRDDLPITLHTFEGWPGIVVGRTGITIQANGDVYHQVWDFETEQNILVPSGKREEDLIEIEPFEDPRTIQLAAEEREEFEGSPF